MTWLADGKGTSLLTVLLLIILYLDGFQLLLILYAYLLWFVLTYHSSLQCVYFPTYFLTYLGYLLTYFLTYQVY